MLAATQRKQKSRRSYLFFKRLFDVCISLLLLIGSLPILFLIGAIILVVDGAPVIYHHQRVGKDGKPFTIYKFRTMKYSELELTEEQIEEYEREFKIVSDPRVTPLGHFLRTTSLDELPQLFNVLKGDMSFVGPRPILRQEFQNYTEEQTALFQSVRPGLTGYWQAYARNHASYQSGMRQKMEMHYLENASFRFDMKIIWKTIGAVIHKTGVL